MESRVKNRKRNCDKCASYRPSGQLDKIRWSMPLAGFIPSTTWCLGHWAASVCASTTMRLRFIPTPWESVSSLTSCAFPYGHEGDEGNTDTDDTVIFWKNTPAYICAYMYAWEFSCKHLYVSVSVCSSQIRIHSKETIIFAKKTLFSCYIFTIFVS